MSSSWLPEIAAKLRLRLPLYLLLLLLVVVFQRWAHRSTSRQSTLSRSLVDLVRKQGFVTKASRIVWFHQDRTYPLALFLAQGPGELADLYAIRVWRAGRSGIAGTWGLRNLSRTESADECQLRAFGQYAAYLSQVQGSPETLTVLDTRGEAARLTQGWPWYARWQNALSNAQRTGALKGFGRQQIVLKERMAQAQLQSESGGFTLRSPTLQLRVDPRQRLVSGNADAIELRAVGKALPGTLTWLVDTVRNIDAIGPGPIEWLEHRVFGTRDWLMKHWYAVFPRRFRSPRTPRAAGESQRAEAEDFESSQRSGPAPPEAPPSLSPILTPSLQGEGRWSPISRDPFVAHYPNSPTAFFQTFLRADRDRPFTAVHVIAWHPSLVRLNLVAGTVEPRSATGATGSGRVPREDRTLGRLVAAFNGGFQALHGEFGMKAEGRVYLPPKPWAATVAVFDDGRVAMGSWLAPPEGKRNYDSSWALDQIPASMSDYRQNLTSVIEGNTINPWGRWWWGAAPLNAQEQTYIDRSGLCLRADGRLAYFWGRSMGPRALGQAMRAAQCVRGMHLDMNLPHTGFEYYRVVKGAFADPLANADLPEGQHAGPVPYARGFRMRARTAVDEMRPMRFPRYIKLNGRDFFYLTLRPTLPGPDLSPQPQATNAHLDQSRAFSAAGLPHSGWPPAFARLATGPAEDRVWLLRIDPRRAVPRAVLSRHPCLAPSSPESDRTQSGCEAAVPNTATTTAHGEAFTVLAAMDGPAAYVGAKATPAEAKATAAALYARPPSGAGGWRYAIGIPPADAVILLRGTGLLSARGDATPAALGIDRDGFVVVAEGQSGSVHSLIQALKRAGVHQALALDASSRIRFADEGWFFLDGTAAETPQPSALAWMANPVADSHILFPQTKPLPYKKWARVQDTRVRYFKKKGPPRFRLPEQLR